ATSRTQGSCRDAATCTIRSSASRSSGSARCRGCSSSPPPVPTATPRCLRSCASIRRAAAQVSRRALDSLSRHLGRPDRAAADAIRSGTAVVGDISNTLVTMPRLMQSPMAAMVFYELIRFNASVPGSAEALVEKARAAMAARQPNEHVRASLAAHAPYSVAPELFRAIKQAVDREPGMPWSVHLAESVDEIEFLERGTGAWRALLEEVGAW